MLPVIDLSESGAGLATTKLFVKGEPPKEVSILFADGVEFYTNAAFVREMPSVWRFASLDLYRSFASSGSSGG